MRYYVALDIPDDVYPQSDPFYAPGEPDDGLDGDGINRDPLGLSSLAMWIDSALTEHPVESTTYASIADLLGGECTSDDPTNHQGDTCPVHEAVAP